MGICTISFDAINHELNLVLFEEERGVSGFLGKVYEQYVSDNGNDNGDDTLPDENPSPTWDMICVSANLLKYG